LTGPMALVWFKRDLRVRDHAALAEAMHFENAPGLVVIEPQWLQTLRSEFPFTHLFSHEETGPGWSYTRDLAVADLCRSQGVHWSELPQTGVVRFAGQVVRSADWPACRDHLPS